MTLHREVLPPRCAPMAPIARDPHLDGNPWPVIIGIAAIVIWAVVTLLGAL